MKLRSMRVNSTVFYGNKPPTLFADCKDFASNLGSQPKRHE